MAWLVMPREIADEAGRGTGRWRLTARSDEGGGGPFGDISHDHGSPEESQTCKQCRAFVGAVTGFPDRDDPGGEADGIR